MSVKGPLKFGCTRLTLAHRTFRGNGSLLRLARNAARCHRKASGSRVADNEQPKWKLHVEIVSRKKENSRQISLPMLIYLYIPWQVMSIKVNLWKLKMLWDWQFAEQKFIEHSKEALVLATRFIVQRREDHIQRCTTPMGYKQIKHDLLRTKEQHSKWPCAIMRFEDRHIYRAMLLKVQRLDHYDHKFAFIDMIFLACRRTNDFETQLEMDEMKQLVEQYADTRRLVVPHPFVLAEFFVRFRRDYSLPYTMRAGHWLVSTYKILQLNVLNSHPNLKIQAKHRLQI